MKPPRSHALPQAPPVSTRAKHRAPKTLRRTIAFVFDSIHAPTSWSFHCDTTDLTMAVRPRIIVCNIEDALKAALAGIGLTRAQSYQVTNSVAVAGCCDKGQKHGGAGVRVEALAICPAPTDDSPLLCRARKRWSKFVVVTIHLVDSTGGIVDYSIAKEWREFCDPSRANEAR
jgi:hypothetical protein